MTVRSPRRRLVTLTTDVGWAYAAQMKAVLTTRIGADRIVDLAHDLPPHAIREAAFLFRAMAERFPSGSVHVCVVDPGVGGRRIPVAVQCAEGSLLVGPDNGVLSLLAERWGIRRVVRLDPIRVGVRDRSGATFEGRDLFAPAAARLASGEPIGRLGEPARLTRVSIPRVTVRSGRVAGEVLHADRFGNLITNIPRATLMALPERVRLRVGRRAAGTVAKVGTYEDLAPGETGVLLSSFGLAEVGVALGSAATRWKARPGDRVTLAPPPRPRGPRQNRSAAHNRK